ncbi:MAG: hypothetical protein P8Q50_15045 [Octadecabacter sp.]|nr:hypothetical protein [Octadecabacter sp.]
MCEVPTDAINSRIPELADIRASVHLHRGKIAGFLSGSIGMCVLTTFMVVAITGVQYGGERVHPDRTIVYPNF